MQYVAYIEYPNGQKGITRSYLQEADSQGMSQNYFHSDTYNGPECSLDSRVLKFSSIVQIRDVLETMIGLNSPVSWMTYGYHGITEAGNATTPFVVMKTGDELEKIRKDADVAYRESLKLRRAYTDWGLPPAWHFAGTAVAREGSLDAEEVYDQLQSHIVNQLEEDQAAILSGIESLRDTNWSFNEIEKDGSIATLHVSRTRAGKLESASVILFALNLMTPGEIRAARGETTE